MDRSTKSVRQVLEPYRMMFKELKGNEKLLPSQYFCKGILKLLGGGASIIRDFSFWGGGVGGSWNLALRNAKDDCTQKCDFTGRKW
jgi:hypothetical protein